MNLDYEAGRFWLGMLNAVGTVAVFAYTWFATRDKDNAQHIKAVEEALSKRIAEYSLKVNDLNTKVAGIEQTLKYMPSQDDISELQGDMKAIKANQEATQREWHTIRQSLNRIEDFLLKAK